MTNEALKGKAEDRLRVLKSLDLAAQRSVKRGTLSEADARNLQPTVDELLSKLGL